MVTKVKAGAVLGVIALVPLLFSLTGAVASNNFYAVGWNYQYTIDDFKPTEIRGAIATDSAYRGKKGFAGVEQDIIIVTDTGDIVVEVCNWYQGGASPVVGIVIYDEQRQIAVRVHAVANYGEVYRYVVSINVPDAVHIVIWDEQWQVILEEVYSTRAYYIKETNSYLEYWQYDLPGEFYYSGWQTVDSLYDPDIGWKTAAECLNKSYGMETSHYDGLLATEHKVIIDQGWKLNGGYYVKGIIADGN